MNDHVDMSDFIAARSDQLNADDLMDNPRTITITKVTASPDSAEQPVSIHYEGGEGRPFKPCKTVRRLMVSVWGKDASKYVGRSMTLYRDPTVSFGGMQVGGIRVSHMSHIDGDKTVALMVTRGRKAPFKVQPLKAPPASQSSDTSGQPAAAIDQDAALKSLTKAADQGTDALANCWKQRGMAPFRDALQLDLDQLKKVAAAADEKAKAAEPETPATEPAPAADQPATDADAQVDRVKAELAAATTSEAVERIIKENERHMTFLPDTLQIALEIAQDNARNRVKAPETAE